MTPHLALSLACVVGPPLAAGAVSAGASELSVGTQAGAQQDQAEIEQELAILCEQVLCRENVAVRLKLPDGATFDRHFPGPLPIVTGSMVTVWPGENVLVEADVEEGRLVNLRAVTELTHAERTLTFRLDQPPDVGDGTGMILKVTSHFPGVLKYRLGLMRVTEKRLEGTSSCPLVAGQPVYEHWPYPIFQVTAKDFRFVDSDSAEASVCE
jgi:hypothetical protein